MKTPFKRDKSPGLPVTQCGNLTQDARPVKGLVKAAGVVGLWTLLSRILGMVRDMVSAKSFGTTWQWDAFVFAFMFPNFFRRLVGEGALSGAFIPVYNETLTQKGKDEAFHFANVLFTLWTVGLLAFLLIVETVISILLASDWEFGQRMQLTLSFLRILFPYLMLLSLFSIGMGVLHCHRRFFAPAVAPALLNLFWIIGVLWIAPMAGQLQEDQLHWLAWIVLTSGVAQLLIQQPDLRKLGFRYRWAFQSAYPEFKKTLSLLLPATLGFAVVQINLLVDMTLAFLLGPGANSNLWYGTRLMQFPLGVFAISMGTALLPAISERIAAKDFSGANHALSFALRNIFLIILPCSVGLIVLREPIVRILFERGEFDAASTARTSAVLLCYTVGLFAYSGQKIFITGFHAMQDIKTPVRMGIVALVSNMIFNLILMVPLKEAGLALATSLSGILQFVMLAVTYQKKISHFDSRPVLVSFAKISIASAAMGIVAVLLFQSIDFFSKNTLGETLRLILAITGAAFSFLIFCILFRVHEVKEAWQWIKRKIGKN